MGGWDELYPNVVWMFGIFLTLQIPLERRAFYRVNRDSNSLAAAPELDQFRSLRVASAVDSGENMRTDVANSYSVA